MSKGNIIFDGALSYKKPSILFAGFIINVFGLFVVYRSVQIADYQKSINNPYWLFNSMFLGVFACLFIFLGLLMFFRFFIIKEIKLKLTEQGILYGKVFSQWSEIKAIWTKIENDDYQLCYQRKASSKATILRMDYCLTEEGYKELFAVLSKELAGKYPDLELGKNNS